MQFGILLRACDEVHSGEKQGYIPVHSGTFRYIRVHSGTFGYIRGRLGHLVHSRPCACTSIFLQQKPRLLSLVGGSVEVQGAGIGGTFGATTYPFYNIRRGKSVRGRGGTRSRWPLEIYHGALPTMTRPLDIYQRPFPCSRVSPVGCWACC